MNQKGFINVVIVVLAIALLGGAGYYFWANRAVAPTTDVHEQQPSSEVREQQPSSEVREQQPSSNEISPTQLSDETADWKTYRNEEYGFELKHPSDQEVKSQKLKSITTDKEVIKFYFGGGLTITLYNGALTRVLQFAPELEHITIAGYPSLIGEGFVERGDYGLLGSIQRGEVIFEIFKIINPLNDYRTIHLPSLPGEEISVPIASEEEKRVFNTIVSTIRFDEKN